MDRHGPQRRVGHPGSGSPNFGLVKQSSAEAILADGSCVELETFACFVDWFGTSYETQIAASDGEYPLLGTLLLDGHHLDINYGAKTVELT